MSILFVCLGNICRSPLVAAVAHRRFALAGLSVEVDSCGTGGWHAGHQADPRSIEVAEAAGYRLRAHRARQLRDQDYVRFDWLLAMDADNLKVLHQRAPRSHAAKLALFLDAAGIGMSQPVPDPYYGDIADFRAVLQLAEQGIDGLIRQLRQKPTAGGNSALAAG